MRRERRDPEARAEVERRALGQRHRVRRGEGHELLRGAVGPAPGDLPQPHPLTHAIRIHARAHRHHRAGAVLVRDHLGERRRLARARTPARLPVGGVHARNRHAHEHLALTGLGLGRSTSFSTSGGPVCV